ncbi:MAG: hypothetical protein ACTSU5_00345 [Promethearchaeota archaeon]
MSTENIFYIDAEHLALDSDTYVDDMGRFLNERTGFEIIRQGNKLKVVATGNFSKRALKTRVKKFLHITDLKLRYKALAIPNEPDTYKIHRRKLEY